MSLQLRVSIAIYFIFNVKSDSNNCLTSSGYSWCPSLDRCYRPFEEVCPVGGDSNGCLSSAGYHWCESLRDCYRPFEEDCPYCRSGLVWCESSEDCYAPIGGYCEDSDSSDDGVPANAVADDQTVSDDSDPSPSETPTDSNGCLTGGGYSWCPSLDRCYRPWEEVCPVGGDSNGCLASAGYHWCESLQDCYRTFEGICPYCRSGLAWCESSEDCYAPIGGYCEDVVPAKSEKIKEISYGEVEITAVATFKSSESGVDGTVLVDENGNIFINLDISELDISVCNLDDNEEIVFEFAIHSKWDYGKSDLQSKHGPEQCTLDINGDILNPFDAPSCTQYDTASKEDKYFACSMGDLSGRFGEAIADDNNKVVLEGNVSEDVIDKESGFCVSRLTPESLYQRSIVFRCKDKESTYLFCAPFEIEKSDIQL